MFLTAPKKTPSLRHYTDEELLRLLRFSDNHEVAELVKRFELLIDTKNEEHTDELEGRREWAIGCVSEYAGEDHHADVVDTLQSALVDNIYQTAHFFKYCAHGVKLRQNDTSSYGVNIGDD